MTPAITIAASPIALTDSAGQQSTVTVNASSAPAAPLPVNITPPAASARYTTTCASPIVIAANATSATCTFTAAPNAVPGDGNTAAVTTVLAGAAGAKGRRKS